MIDETLPWWIALPAAAILWTSWGVIVRHERKRR